jgi:hypothetical protein
MILIYKRAKITSTHFLWHYPSACQIVRGRRKYATLEPSSVFHQRVHLRNLNICEFSTQPLTHVDFIVCVQKAKIKN